MRRIKLDALPNYSVWPSRLLGLTPWATPKRTIDKVDSEYDKDKYARCLKHHHDMGISMNPWDMRQFETGYIHKICISRINELYEVSYPEAVKMYSKILWDTMKDDLAKVKTVVELGCGYGFNLWELSRRNSKPAYVGGEYSQNAIELSRYLCKTTKVIKFNYYEAETYEFLGSLKSPILVFTVHSIEQLPSANMLPSMLSKYKNNIRCVFHFEPCYEMFGSSLLGLMRRKYIEANDYNRDLFSTLNKDENIGISDCLKFHAIGLNPLNPTSIIKWRFC